MTAATATAAEFYDAGYRYVDGSGQTGSGMTSGASSDAGARRGLTHVYVNGTGRTACGRKLAGTPYRINRTLPGAAPARAINCPRCRANI